LPDAQIRNFIDLTFVIHLNPGKYQWPSVSVQISTGSNITLNIQDNMIKMNEHRVLCYLNKGFFGYPLSLISNWLHKAWAHQIVDGQAINGFPV
jgi:hypothetical protein